MENAETPKRVPVVRTVLRRGLRGRCPQCGVGRIHKSFFSRFESCPHCGLKFVRDPIDVGMFLYASTAAITGLFVVGYLLIGFPSGGWARLGVAAGGLSLMVLTWPSRYALGVAVTYLADLRFDVDTALKLRPVLRPHEFDRSGDGPSG